MIGLVIAVITALIRISKPQGKFKAVWAVVRAVFSFYVWLFRSTPLLVQLFIVFFGLPNVGIQFNAWTAGIITFSLNTGAYASETIRGALLSIPDSQWDAAYSIGMKRPPPGLAGAPAAAVQLLYRFGEGHVLGQFDYDRGNVYGQPTDRL